MQNKKILPDENKIAKGATNANRPAFPSDFNYGDEDFTGAPQIVHKTSFGLTKREYFAAMAMQGMLANNWNEYAANDPECENMAATAINFADALLKALEK